MVVLQLFHGALGIARSLGRLGVDVFAAGDERGTAVARSRYVRGFRHISFAPAARRQTLATLLKLGERLGRPLLMPTADVAALFVDEHAAELHEAFLFPRQPAGLAPALSSKRGMYELCLEHGVPTPATAFPTTPEEALGLVDSMTLPVVLKPLDASKVDGVDRTTIARSGDEVVRAFKRLGTQMILQEYIPGGSDSVWMFNGYFGENSACLFGLTARKIRQFPPNRGVTSLGETQPSADVFAQTTEFMRALGYRGVLDCGYRFDQRDGKFKLLDVNPRNGDSFRLFVDSAGMDVARAAYLDLTGETVNVGEPVWGRRWIVEDMDAVSALHELRHGHRNVRSLARSYRGLREGAWFARDDPIPFLWQAARRLRGLVRADD